MAAIKINWWHLPKETELITKLDLNTCPAPVIRYLTRAGVLGKSRKRWAQVNHSGTFRLKPKQRWFPIIGEYHFHPESPSFVWLAKINLFPFIFISVKDEYKNGAGRSHVKLESLITLGDQSGPQTSESSLGRLLVELVLIPTALVPTDYLRWEPIDSRHARVILKNNEFEVSAIFEFNDEDLPLKTSIDRFGNFDGKVIKTSFVCELSKYELFEDLLLPSEITGSWDFEEGSFSWLHFKINHVHFE